MHTYAPARAEYARRLTAEYDRLDQALLRSRSGAKWRVPRADTLAAWVADMDFPIAEAIRDSLREVSTHAIGYPDWPDGVTPLREVFVARMAKLYGWRPNPGEVREFTDVTQAVQAALYLATEPGDRIAMHTPAFGPFHRSIARMGRQLLPIPLSPDNGWAFDAERLEHDVATQGCRLLLLVNPQNPTGRVFTRAELWELAEIAERHDLLVISDEIHSDLIYRPHQHIPFASLDRALEARTITVTSASKGFNLAGIRCAVGHVGPAKLRSAFEAQPSNLFGMVNVLGVNATIAAWTEGHDWLATTIDYLHTNRALVDMVLANRAPRIRYRSPEATYLGWLDCRELGWGANPAEIFEERARIALSPGPDFGPGGDGFVRLNFATSRQLLRTLLDGLVASARH